MNTLHSLVVALVATITTPVFAEDQATLVTAREVAKEGVDAFDAGRYEEASTKLVQAYQVVKVPTLAVYAARSFAQQGKLIKASELYLEASRLPPDPSWQKVQREMQQVAEQEREQLLPRIPRLSIVLQGAAAGEVEVTLDGAVVPETLVTAEQRVDPGLHRVVGKRGAQKVGKEATLLEGENQSVTLDFGTAATGATPLGSGPPTGPADSGSGKANTLRFVGWTAVGVGGASLAVGTVTGLLAMSKRSALLDDGCRDTKCYDDQRGDVDSYNGLRTVSTWTFIGGAVVAAAGATILLTTPKEQGPRAVLMMGPGSVDLLARF